ncbi:MAG: hypothetical protein RID53_08225 [Coleofasciculus sp. B1-GNL1-01]|uniref:hypothetical protein n=1 Tax=Coleofasciculus sp. B1-GNL1-01 TaxID=3068484 RepID=UPI00330263A9
MTYNTHCRRPNVPFPEELTNARIEAEDIESFAPNLIFGIPQTHYPAGSALIPELNFGALPSSFDPHELLYANCNCCPKCCCIFYINNSSILIGFALVVTG